MPIAKTNIEDIKKFNSSVENFQTSINELSFSFEQETEAIINVIGDEIKQAEVCVEQLNVAEQSLAEKLSIKQTELESLNATLSITPPTVTEYETIDCGTDDEGNSITETIAVEVPNLEYLSLVAQITETESVLAEMDFALSALCTAKAQLQNTIERLGEARQKLTETLEEFVQVISRVQGSSDNAISQLNKAVATIEEYQSAVMTTVASTGVGGLFLGGSKMSVFPNNGSMPPRMQPPPRNLFDKPPEAGGSVFYGIGGRHHNESFDLLNSQGTVLIDAQGNRQPYPGTCGLASTANVIRQQTGTMITEEEVVRKAVQNRLCDQSHVDSNGRQRGGGTNNQEIVDLMSHYNLRAQIVPSLSLDDITTSIDHGGSVMMSIQSKYLEGAKPANKANIFARTGNCDHWVTVKGVTRDALTNEVTAVVVHNTWSVTDNGAFQVSGNHRNEVFIPVRDFRNMRALSSDFAGITIFK